MSILDPKWKYTHSTATDIRKTFAKARQKLAQSKASKRPNTPEANMAPLCGASGAAASSTGHS